MFRKNSYLLLFWGSFFCSAQHTSSPSNSGEKTILNKETHIADTSTKTEVIDSTFVIAENPQKFYRGIYKKNTPYNGYFKINNSDVFWVNFYKNGQKTTQYSFDLLKMFTDIKNPNLLKNPKTILDIKSTFKNGEIVNGEIKEKYKNIYISRKFSDSKMVKVNADILSMSGIRRLNIEVNKENLVFSYLKDSLSTIRVSLNKNNKLILKLLTNKTILSSYNLNDYSLKKTKPNSIILFFKVNDSTHYLVMDKEKEFLKYKDNMSIIGDFIVSISSFTSKKNTNDILEQYLENLKYPFKINKKQPLTIGHLITNKHGVIEKGIYWKGDTQNNGSYQIYKNGNVIEEEKISLENFQPIVNKFIKNSK